MVEVLLANLHRLHDLWPVFLEHIVEALGDARAPFRSATLDCLNKAIGGALASVVTISAGEKLTPRASRASGIPLSTCPFCSLQDVQKFLIKISTAVHVKIGRSVRPGKSKPCLALTLYNDYRTCYIWVPAIWAPRLDFLPALILSVANWQYGIGQVTMIYLFWILLQEHHPATVVLLQLASYSTPQARRRAARPEMLHIFWAETL